MAQATSYNSSGNREDLSNLIARVEPEQTPVFSSIPTAEKATNTYTEWQLDDLAPPAFSGVVEGVDVTNFSNATANRARIGNYTQKFRNSWSVSTEQELSNPAGVSSDVAEAKVKKAIEHRRDIECAICSDNDRQAGDGVLPSKLRALGDWIDSAGPADVPARYRTPAASIDATAGGSLAESHVNAVLQSLYEASGGMGTFTLFAGPTLKSKISGFTRASSATYQVTQEASAHRMDRVVDTYVGDYGTVSIVPTTFNGWDDGDNALDTVSRMRGYLIKDGTVKKSFMAGISSYDLPNEGAGKKGYVESIMTLLVTNPRSLGKFAATS
jgi:hypothetical protein